MDASWFSYAPSERFAGSVVDTSSWLDAPAGKHGPLGMRGKELVFQDGTPIKFWGVNICGSCTGVPNDTARQWAEKLAVHGVNGVRFHKFTYPGDGIIGTDKSTAFDPVRAERWDFFSAQLKERGIYTGWSHIYGLRLCPGDRERVNAYDEITGALSGHLKGSTYGLVNFARDLQDLSIELTVNMLNRGNPYTGMRYADDPALAYVELQNEDDIFFPTTMDAVNSCPTYKKMFCRQFSDWLRKKYGSHRELVQAWGERAIDAYPEYQTGEHLDHGNIYPIAHFWWYGPDGLESQEKERGARKRLLDTARFLYETQNDFYLRYTDAIRATGFKGCLVGSPWQAGSGISHYYNLHSDALVGIVDRHNYFGGSGGHVLEPGTIDNTAMVSLPGAGLLSTGFQQVADRPFFNSEWICRLPNEWIAEGPPIVAAYGMGLQGWAGSFEFASNYSHHTDKIDMPNVYNTDAPTQIGLYPAIARMVYGGELKEGRVVADRALHIDSLMNGRVGFDEAVAQQGDTKAISGTVPREALAVGRVTVSFSDAFSETKAPDLSAWWDAKNKVITATTGQLKWHYDGNGYFTINLPGTRAVVGFAQDRLIILGDVSICVKSRFAVVLVSSLEKGKPISEASALLITAIARTRNTGMKMSDDGSVVESVGGAPMLIEGVKAEIVLEIRREYSVNVLDVNGFRTGRQLMVDNGRIIVDGARNETIYYEVMLNKN